MPDPALQPKRRVSVFVDGFNLYHAVANLGRPHLKWIDLRALATEFIQPSHFILGPIYYFSAYATWRKAAVVRHRHYVQALQAIGVTPILGEFKAKDRSCHRCGASWVAHEEKQTDVNIAIHLLNEARKNTFDVAVIMSADSDFVPAINMLHDLYPAKGIKIITPVGLHHSMKLFWGFKRRHVKRMEALHVERSLLPQEVRDASGNVVATRPPEYDPPV